MFHLKDGLCFERIDFDTVAQPCSANDPCRWPAEMIGGVRICTLRKGENMKDGSGITVACLTASEWASVVASMSAFGETSTSYAMFLAAQKR